MEKNIYKLVNKLNRQDLFNYSKTVNFQSELAAYLHCFIDYFKQENIDLDFCFDLRGCCLGLMTLKQIEDNKELTLYRYLKSLNNLSILLNEVIYLKKCSKKQKKDLIDFFKWTISCLSNLNLKINKDFLKLELKGNENLIDRIF